MPKRHERNPKMNDCVNAGKVVLTAFVGSAIRPSHATAREAGACPGCQRTAPLIMGLIYEITLDTTVSLIKHVPKPTSTGTARCYTWSRGVFLLGRSAFIDVMSRAGVCARRFSLPLSLRVRQRGAPSLTHHVHTTPWICSQARRFQTASCLAEKNIASSRQSGLFGVTDDRD